jgi:hypothetical protein
MSDEPFDPWSAEHGSIPQSALIREQAQQVALYHQTLKDQGLNDHEALTLTRDWLAESFEQAE